jgi:hypothetical protein
MNKGILIAAVVSAEALWAQGTPRTITTSSPDNFPGWNGEPTGVGLPHGQAGPVTGRPLTATEVYRSTQTLADGTHVDRSDTALFYRDIQGRMRTESQGTVVIFDPVAGFLYFPHPADKTYSQTAIGNPNALTWVAATGSGMSVMLSGARQAPGDPAALLAQRRLGLPASRPVTETLAPQNVNGIPSNGSRVTIIIPRGALGNDREIKVVNERWYSDDLKVLVKSTNSDPRYGVTTYDLTQVVQGPPDPALFQAPVGYRLLPSR